jgi:hypothetical protein
VDTSTTTLLEVSTNRIAKVRVDVGRIRLVRRRSCEDSSKADFGQSTSTRSEHKPLALPEVCTKQYQRDYDCRNRQACKTHQDPSKDVCLNHNLFSVLDVQAEMQA